MPMPTSKKSSSPSIASPSIKDFQKLDKKLKLLMKSKDKNKVFQGETLRYHAIEWLRLESWKRAEFSNEECCHIPSLAIDLVSINKGKHHWLVLSQDKPPRGWYFPVPPSFIRKLAAVEAVAPGQTLFGPTRESVGPFSVDLSQTDKVICDAFIKGHIAPLRKKVLGRGEPKSRENIRAKGGGRTHSLDKLTEALTLYDEYKTKKTKQCALGFDAKTWPSNQGEKIIRTAKQMIKMAKDPWQFHATFGK